MKLLSTRLPKETIVQMKKTIANHYNSEISIQEFIFRAITEKINKLKEEEKNEKDVGTRA